MFWKNEPKTPADNFEILAVVGKGNFSRVFQARQKNTGHIYAMKVLRKHLLIERKQVQHIHESLKIIAQIRHPFIMKIKSAFHTNDKLYLILDFINGGELFYHLKKEGRFSESRVRLYVAEMVLALEYLHKRNVVVRDLKPEDMLLDADGHVVLVDFSLAKDLLKSDGKTLTFCGTPEYLAPELLKGEPYGKDVDWWALGTIMYEFLTGLPPFYSKDVNAMYQKILNGYLRFHSYMSPEVIGLLEGLLTRDPRQRLGYGPTDAEVIKAHPFFASINWKECEERKCKPEFIPKLTGLEDVSLFDPQFTSLKAIDPPGENLEDEDNKQFVGFEYTTPE